MQNAIAFSDNDIAVVAWSYGRKLPGCMGFAVYRIDENGDETALPSMAVFPGSRRKPGQTTADFPVQKFYWKDPYARLVAGQTGARKFRYKVVPLQGKPGALTPMPVGYAISNEVEVTPHISDTLSAYFNRGIISTQHVSLALGGNTPSKGNLLKRVADPKDSLRTDLAGEMIDALTGFVAEAEKPGGQLYCALYELGDRQLIEALSSLKKRLHVVLSNPSPSDEQSASNITDGNVESRKALKAAGAQVYDRMLPGNRIGHNKFCVLVQRGKPAAVLFGSTNWTSTGLCTQTNNTIIWRDAALAQRYYDYWQRLVKDTEQAGATTSHLQGKALRSWDAKSKVIKLAAPASVTSWFSPNTPTLRKRNHANEARPPDMDEVARLMLKARHAILFLAFYPGNPSVMDWAAQAQKADRKLFVRGCVTNPAAAQGYAYTLAGTEPPRRKKGDPPGKQDPRVISAVALDKVIPAGWRREILNAGFAVTHDKIIVIDPFTDDCVVITGSHNLGYKASYNNDENLIIVKGDRELAESYATHVLDIYDHFSWRHLVQTKGEDESKADASLSTDADAWQAKYFSEDGSVRNAQLRFWLSALPSNG
jgi:phosphatidylserine/phosphatidylglycerophosphate/cardiolipin synthase-like enzyme